MFDHSCCLISSSRGDLGSFAVIQTEERPGGPVAAGGALLRVAAGSCDRPERGGKVSEPYFHVRQGATMEAKIKRFLASDPQLWQQLQRSSFAATKNPEPFVSHLLIASMETAREWVFWARCAISIVSVAAGFRAECEPGGSVRAGHHTDRGRGTARLQLHDLCLRPDGHRQDVYHGRRVL